MENQQELIFKLSMFEQQMQQLQQQIQAVEQSIVDLQDLNVGLNEIKGGKDKKIKAMIGRGIFIESKITSEDLLVDVGGKNFVRKSIPETQGLIEEQIVKLGEARESLKNSIEEVSNKAEKLVEEFREKD